VNVAVFGLGYLGVVSSVCFADLGHAVVGVDINEEQVGRINSDGELVIDVPGPSHRTARCLGTAACCVFA
jgi:UDP-glucose 6-dehydrogenase